MNIQSKANHPLVLPPPSDDVIFVPVVIHLVHNPQTSLYSKQTLESRIHAQIKQLNEDFSMRNANFFNTKILPQEMRKHMGAAHIQFYLATEQANGKPSSAAETGSTMLGVSYTQTKQRRFKPGDGPFLFQQLKQSPSGIASWDPERYLNIWVAELEGYSGLAQYPWQYHISEEAKRYDGVVIDMQAFGIDEKSRGARAAGRTLTHEIGHWLGLLHPFHVSRSGEDDFVEDTPIHHTGECKGYLTWETAPPALVKTETGLNQGKAYFMNFMDYTWDYCRNSFTKGQVERMRSVFSKEHVPIAISPETVQGSRSYFQFPKIVPLSGSALVCQNVNKDFVLPNVPGNLITWKASDGLKIIKSLDPSNKISVSSASGLGSGSGTITATIRSPQGSGSRILKIPVEVFSPRIVGPKDPGGKPDQFLLDPESRIHVSNYKWSVSPGLQLAGSPKALQAEVQYDTQSKSKAFLQLISLNIETDCAGKLSLIKEAHIEPDNALPFTIAPNPASQSLALAWKDKTSFTRQGYRVRMNNLSGNTVYLGSGWADEFRLETGRFSRGMYQLVVTRGKERYMHRILLE